MLSSQELDATVTFKRIHDEGRWPGKPGFGELGSAYTHLFGWCFALCSASCC